MLQIKGNMFDLVSQYDAICITTNGFVTSRGKAVMGRGCAKRVSQLVPGIEYLLGDSLKADGNTVVPLCRYPSRSNTTIVSFPVKGIGEPATKTNVVSHARNRYKLGAMVPGFHLKADIVIIANSAMGLVDLTNEMGWSKVLIPRPGCGAGELDWDVDVEPILEHLLDSRFTIITF